MKDKKAEKLKKRIGIDTVCYFMVSGICLLNIYSKITMLTTLYKYAREEIEEIAEVAGDILGYVMICLILFILGLMLLHIRKNGKPFSKSNIRKLQIIAGLTIGCGILPSVLATVITFICTGSAFLDYGVHEICIMFLGSAIGILSEIFYYGNELQDDMDSIA